MSLVGKIFAFLSSVKEELAEMATADGLVFQVDDAGILIDEFGKTVADGQYEMADGSVIEVVEGKYTVIEKSEAESEAEPGVSVEVEVEEKEEEMKKKKAEMQTEAEAEIEALKKEIEILRAKIAGYESEAEKMSAKLASVMKPKTETLTETVAVADPTERIRQIYKTRKSN